MSLATKKCVYTIFFVTIVFLFALFIFQTFSVAQFNMSSEDTVTKTLVETTKNNRSTTFLYNNESEYNDNESIVFHTSHKTVEAYVENEKIYSLEQSGLPYFETTGAVWNVIPIKSEYLTKPITIVIKPIYNDDDSDTLFFAGNFRHILHGLFIADLGEIVITISLFFIVLFVLLFSLIKRKKNIFNKNIFFLSIFTLVVGLWRLPEIEILKILIPNGIFWSNFELLALTFIPLSFCLTARNSFLVTSVKTWNTLSIISIITILTILSLQVFEIKNIRETLQLTHITIMIVVCTCIIQIAIEIIKTKRIASNLVGLIILILSTLYCLLAHSLFKANPILGSAGLFFYLIFSAMKQIAINQDLELTAAKSDIYKKLSEVDEMTKLLNKRGIINHLEKTFAKCENGAFFMIDIDNFKNINDTFGHDYGDKVLTEIAQKISGLFRESDLIGRYGGDEFFVFMKNPIEKRFITAKAQKLVESIEKTYNEDSIEVTVSASVGISLFPEHGSTFEDLYKNADTAMYTIKHTTKNQYAIYTEN